MTLKKALKKIGENLKGIKKQIKLRGEDYIPKYNYAYLYVQYRYLKIVHTLNRRKVYPFLGLGGTIAFGLSMIGINLFNFFICLSILYPQFTPSTFVSENYHFASYMRDTSITAESGTTNSTTPAPQNISQPVENQTSAPDTNNEEDVSESQTTVTPDILEYYYGLARKNSASSGTSSETKPTSTEHIAQKQEPKKVVEKKPTAPTSIFEKLGFGKKDTDNEIELTSAPEKKPTTDTNIPKTETSKPQISTPVVTPPSPPITPTPVEKQPQAETPKQTVVEPTPVKTPEPTPSPTPTPVKVIKAPQSDTLAQMLEAEMKTVLDGLGGGIFAGFENRVLKSDNMFLENGVWYTYVYPNYKSFGKGVTPSETDRVSGGLDYKKTILMLDPSLGGVFLTEYTKVKLISDSIISDVAGKRQFLRELVDDKKYLHADTDDTFTDLKSATESITSGLSNSQKIAKIYAYIMNNVSYTHDFNVNNREIFSGIATFDTKVGSCGGYAKMFLYMLSFAGVGDANVIRGNVIDAPDFPTIGHAWVRVGGAYYDPTFDDPIGNTKAKSFSEYKYFGLPKDIFYSNRFNYGTLPENLKSASVETRKNYIQEKLYALADTYANSSYLLLEGAKFRKKHGIAYNEAITIEKLKDVVPYFEVNNSTIIKNDVQVVISTNTFFTVNDGNLEDFLVQIHYNIDEYTLLKWDDGKYRFSKEVTYN